MKHLPELGMDEYEYTIGNYKVFLYKHIDTGYGSGYMYKYKGKDAELLAHFTLDNEADYSEAFANRLVEEWKKR